MSERTHCCIPGCASWSTKMGAYNEWVCGKHYKRVVAHLKAMWRDLKREHKRILKRKPHLNRYWECPPGSADRLVGAAMHREQDAVWARIKRAAAEELGL